jgi:6-phosphogluconolactonase (cycloisomerase 2 family)
LNANGSLGTPVQGSPFANVGDSNRSVIDGSDRFFFSCDRDTGGVHAYTVSSNGVLVDNGSVAGGDVINFQIDPTGQFLVAPSAASDTVTELSVNQTTGVLTQGPTAVFNTSFGANTAIIVPAPGAPLLGN